MNPLVSIIIPCFNGESTIQRAIQSVINQNYRPIQLIVINDGSTDHSLNIIESTKKTIALSGIEMVLINQKNRGLGGAIDTGLKYVNGKYLAWIDADDELMPKSVSIRVDYLETNDDFSSVSSDAYLVTEQEWEKPKKTLCHNKELNKQEDQFENMLLGKSLFCSGCHLIRYDRFVIANNGNSIYPAKHGQNWQMLLPIYYNAKHGFIDLPLYKYRIDSSSMSGLLNTASSRKIYKRHNECIRLVDSTLRRIKGLPPYDRKRYMHVYRMFVYDRNIDIALDKKKPLEKYFWALCKKLSFSHHKF